jgi:hypothetical protein
MKKLFLICSLLLGCGSIQLMAQAPYTGGSGDGYAGNFFEYFRGDPPGLTGPALNVFPNPVQRGNPAMVRAEGVAYKVELLVYTPTGQRLARYVSWEAREAYVQELTTSQWPVGVYLIEVRFDGKARRAKLFICE